MFVRKTLLCSSIAAVLAASSVMAAPLPDAAADASSASDPASRDAKPLDTITVTATKRSTPLQKTPVAITAISANTPIGA